MKKLAVAMLCLTLAGCGVMDMIRGKDDELAPLKPNPLPSISEEATLSRAWSYNVGKGNPDGLRPALGAETIYVASPSGRVAAVELESGTTRWSSRQDISISAGVGTGEGLVMVGGLDGEVVALDSRDGANAWRTTVGSEVLAPPHADSGSVIVRTIDGSVVGLSSASGEQRWIMRRSLPSLTLRGAGPPIINQGIAVMGFDDGRLAAVNMENGAVAWEVPVARPSGTNEVERIVDVDAPPLLQGGVLYAAAFQGAVTALDLRSNQQLWSKEASTHTDLAADADNLYFSDSTGRVHALDRLTGDELWVQDQLLRRRLSGPASVGGYLLVGDYEGYLHILDKSDGQLVGRRDLGGRISMQPVVRDDQILVLTNDGRLHSLSIAASGG